MAWHIVPGAETIASGSMKQLALDDGEEILVLRGGDAFFACQKFCPHLDTPLEEGMFDGKTLTCHQHLWQWDIATGAPQGLAEGPLECFRVKAENGNVYVWRDD